MKAVDKDRYFSINPIIRTIYYLNSKKEIPLYDTPAYRIKWAAEKRMNNSTNFSCKNLIELLIYCMKNNINP